MMVVFSDRALEFEHDNGDAVNEHDAVWNAELLLETFNLKLVDDLENIVFGVSKSISSIYRSFCVRSSRLKIKPSLISL
jgi:hypothetical protein